MRWEGRKDMVVKCINNVLAEKYLTVGKEYKAVLDNWRIILVDDTGTSRACANSRFTEVTEPQSHHNTTNLEGAELDKAESKAKSQERAVLNLFIEHNKLTVGQAWEDYLKHLFPYKGSIGRAFTNLKNKGLIYKTNELTQGKLGASEYYYQLIK